MTSFNSQILRDEERCVMQFETNDVEKLKIMEQVARCLVDGASTMGEISDGYHTFNELYDHRAVLFAVICNEHPHLAWKSKLHHTGDMFDDMFIVGLNTSHGQISYHYDMKMWDLFVVPDLDRAPKWDGHTPADAVKRLERVAEDASRKKDFLHFTPKDNIIPDAITAQQALDILTDFFLGEDYYIAISCSPGQANAIITENIMMQFERKYKKFCKKRGWRWKK